MNLPLSSSISTYPTLARSPSYGENIETTFKRCHVTSLKSFSSPNLGRSLYRDRRSQPEVSVNLKPGTYRNRGNRRDPCSQLSRGVAVIIPQHSTEPLTAFDVADNPADFVTGLNQFVSKSLMVSFGVKMLEIGSDRPPCCPPQHSAVFCASSRQLEFSAARSGHETLHFSPRPSWPL